MTFNIFIPGEVPSSKNSKQWTGKFLVSSKLTQNYTANTAYDYLAHKRSFFEATNYLSKPLKVGFLFVRGSRRRFDYINPLQTVQDLMVKHGWLEDDNADILLPVLLPYEYKKNGAGVYISVLP